MVVKLGYGVEYLMYCHFLILSLGLDYGLHSLNVDADVLEMSKYVREYKIMLVYVEHGSSNVDTSMFDSSPDVNRNVKKESEKVSSKLSSIGEIMKKLSDCENTKKLITRDESTWKQMVVHVSTSFTTDDFSFGKFKKVEVEAYTESEEKESDTEGNDTSGSDSEDLDYDSKHEDVFDDDEHIVEEVHVNMNNFSFTTDLKHDTSIGVVYVQEDDLNVIDYDSFGSDIDDEIDSERRIQLRELRRISNQKTRFTQVHKRGSSNSNEDLIKKISHSIYVTNFPDSVTSRDLRRECSNYGTVVDVFIPLKKSKAGRRFALVRFIKVFNLDRLVENLCTIWIGRHHLYANKVRFERPQRSNDSPSNDTFKATDKHGSHLGGRQHSGHNRSYASAVNGGISRVQPTSLISPSPAMVLDDSCIIERDFSNHVMGKVRFERPQRSNDSPSMDPFKATDKQGSLLGGSQHPGHNRSYASAVMEGKSVVHQPSLILLEFDNGDVKSNFMQHIGVKSWIFIDSNLFFRIFNTFMLFFRIFNTSKLFSGNFKKCKVLKLKRVVSCNFNVDEEDMFCDAPLCNINNDIIKNEVVEEIELQKGSLVMLVCVGVTKRLQRPIAAMWILMI
nr:RNA-directed DNA polymerase, eukaryota, nucleotide-binding alpha-beta plait domain protein [Tanacetum cinerariifolium]